MYVLGFFFFLIFIYRSCTKSYAARRVFSGSVSALVPGSGIEPGPPALGTQRLSPWTAREVPPYGFDVHFPDDCSAAFHALVDHLYIFFGEMSIQVLCPFFNGWCCY